MFQSIVTPQGNEKVTIHLNHTHKGVLGAKLFLSKVSLEVLQNEVLIQLIVMPHLLEKVCTGSNIRSVPINRIVSFNWNQRVVT